MKGNRWCTVCSGRAGPILGPTAQSRTSPPAILVSQISTQRRMNIYNILQEIIQQEGELEEPCVQRLVAIASQEMRELPKVAGPWAPSGFHPTTSPGLGCWKARPGMSKALVQLPQGARTGFAPGSPAGLEQAGGGRVFMRPQVVVAPHVPLPSLRWKAT